MLYICTATVVPERLKRQVLTNEETFKKIQKNFEGISKKKFVVWKKAAKFEECLGKFRNKVIKILNKIQEKCSNYIGKNC